jgi:hypothetical protein
VGVYKPIDHYGYLSVCQASSSPGGRYLHDLPWVTHWAPVVVSHYQYESMGMGHRVLIAGGREGTDGEVWRRLQGISSQGTYVIPETDLFFQGPRSIY